MCHSAKRVNDGLSDFKPGLKVDDKIAMGALILLVVSGLYYSLRMIFTPDDVIAEGFPEGEAWVDANWMILQVWAPLYPLRYL